MPFSSPSTPANHPDFIFVGDHPALDFANTLAVDEGQPKDFLGTWTEVIAWLSATGLSTSPNLNLPSSRSVEALEGVLKLRRIWKGELDKLVKGNEPGDDFIRQLNQFLAGNLFHESLRKEGKKHLHLERSPSELRGEKLVLAILARQIALFLSESNPEYLRRCANTSSCVLYFYDSTKNHRRHWCSTATCGNRHKVAEFRKRQGNK